jgi:hypothetical protein
MKTMMIHSWKLSLAISALGAALSTSSMASPRVVMTCETVGNDLTSRFAVYDRDAGTFLVEWVGHRRHVEGYAPLISEVVRKSSLLQIDTGGDLISEDPHRVKLELDLRTGKGLMKYYKWYGYKSSLFSRTADLKLEAAVVCESQ